MMTPHWLPACLLVLTLANVQGSDLEFSSSATTLQSPITKNLTMKCSLADSASPSHAIVGRDLSHVARDLSRVARDLTNTALQDLTHSDKDVKYVNSIVVTKNGVDIASISEHVAAQALGNYTNLQVTGSISSSAAVKGFLELRWLYPKSEDAGTYKCDVTGMDVKGHTFSYSKTLEIVETDVTMASLAKQIGSMQMLNDLLKTQMNNMNAQITLMMNQISQLQAVRYTGGPCDVTDQCAGDLQCQGKGQGHHGTCGCPIGQYLLDDDSCAAQGGLGAHCTSTDQCLGSNVQCDNNQCSAVVYTGGHCDVTHRCVGDLLCQGGRCGCPSGHYLVDDHTCSVQADLGGTCTTTDQCLGSNISCVNHVCGCEAGFIAVLDICLPDLPSTSYHSANSGTQAITSPGYPGKYTDNLGIDYWIVAPSGKHVRVTFTHVDLEPGYDYIDVFDGFTASDTKLARVTGYAGSSQSLQYVGHSYTSSGRYLFLHFRTDGSRVYTGFRATFTAVN